MKRKEYIRTTDDIGLVKFLLDYDLNNISDGKYCEQICPNRIIHEDGTPGCSRDLENEGCSHTDEEIVLDWLNEEMEEE